MNTEEQYMQRCIQLAKSGAGNVAPNPMVGAVLVYDNKIIGEGFHKKYGQAHAEVNCVKSVADENKALIPQSTLFVSLEPCSHFGKTPPCTDLVIENNIKKVVIGCKDLFKEVAGKGIEKLKNAGIEVISEVLKNECIDLNKRFFTFHGSFRPYIILKWAQSANAKIGVKNKRTFISNDYTNRLVHKWRSEEAAILIGTNTAINDDPLLTTRLWSGKNPVRILIDKELRLPSSSKIFNKDARTIIYNLAKDAIDDNLHLIKIGHKTSSSRENENLIDQILHSLFEINIQSILVEGGAKTLQSFINSGLWDEARVITNEKLIIENGIPAPEIKDFTLEKQERYDEDLVSYFYKIA
ncbi:MAG: bifunctional diaminohydroxyphosphoribosylaminopyrimidine deaminase/5-amino-6-(5-phosphoribosylamino)uracil reductase RibD [Ginsengibacter sp.]